MATRSIVKARALCAQPAAAIFQAVCERSEKIAAASAEYRRAVRQALVVACAGIAFFSSYDASGQTAATGVGPHYEYRKRIEAAQNISALVSGLFGETVSLYNGSTTFSVTDIDVPGNNSLPVRLVRRLAIEIQPQGSRGYDSRLGGVGDWHVDVPCMAATYPTDSGWHPDRCSTGSVPSIVFGEFLRNEAWQGISVNVPGRGVTAALGLYAETPRPTDGAVYKLTTTERDVFDCIAMKSGLSGDGFRMTTTDGIRYYFDTAVTRTDATLERWTTDPDDVQYQHLLPRTRYYLLASKVEDRFGNSVNYVYDSSGRLGSIYSSDGRQITLGYSNGQLSTATAHGQTWQYQYVQPGDGYQLSAVIRPDGSTWKYAYSNGLKPAVSEITTLPALPYCKGEQSMLDYSFVLTATHPGGARGQFEFRNLRHYRSGVHATECLMRGADPETQYFTLFVPHYFDVVSLLSKKISGTGLGQGLAWTYDYGSAWEQLWGSYDEPPTYPCSTCTRYKTVSVTNPDATRLSQTFGMLYLVNDGVPFTKTMYDAAGNVASSESYEYVPDSLADQQLFFSHYGRVLGGVADPETARVRPMVKRTIRQDGSEFTWQVPMGCGGTGVYCMDAFARPTKEVRASAPAP